MFSLKDDGCFRGYVFNAYSQEYGYGRYGYGRYGYGKYGYGQYGYGTYQDDEYGNKNNHEEVVGVKFGGEGIEQ